MNWPETEPIATFTHHLRSRYSETDRMGYVYYARYLEYFEVARTEMIRNMGISYRKLEEQGYMLPVVDAQLKYHAPVNYDDLLSIAVFIFKMPGVKMETYYKVSAENLTKTAVTGKVTLCFIQSSTRKPCRAPQYFTQQFLIEHQTHN